MHRLPHRPRRLSLTPLAALLLVACGVADEAHDLPAVNGAFGSGGSGDLVGDASGGGKEAGDAVSEDTAEGTGAGGGGPDEEGPGAGGAGGAADDAGGGDAGGGDAGGGDEVDPCAACVSGVCMDGLCQPPRCDDGVHNGDETDVDCGGSCGPCQLDEACGADHDCASGFCDTAVCGVAPSCAAIKLAHPASADGIFTIDPDGAAPTQVYCDMTTDGGGWTLLATLASTTLFYGQSAWRDWSVDWWTIAHGDPTNLADPFSNHDFRRFKPRIDDKTVLRASNPHNAVRRYHFGFAANDWDLWNAPRTADGVAVEIIGPFNLPGVKVSCSPDLGGAVPARSNGHWHHGAFLLGTAPNHFDHDSEGLAARFQVGSSLPGHHGYVGDVRVGTTWHLWLR